MNLSTHSQVRRCPFPSVDRTTGGPSVVTRGRPRSMSPFGFGQPGGQLRDEMDAFTVAPRARAAGPRDSIDGYGGTVEPLDPSGPARKAGDRGGRESKAHHIRQLQPVRPQQVHDADSISPDIHTDPRESKPAQTCPTDAEGKRFSAGAQATAVRAESESQGQGCEGATDDRQGQHSPAAKGPLHPSFSVGSRSCRGQSDWNGTDRSLPSVGNVTLRRGSPYRERTEP